MKLATYSPEVSRLRRVAKACAAGELSRSEYRKIRRYVIANMTGDTGKDDKTRPRFLEETTVRRALPLYRSVETSKRQPFFWMLLVCLLLAGLSIPAGGWGQFVPPVAERASNSVRYQVETIAWHQSDTQFDQTEIDELLASSLAELSAQESVGLHGFTAGELEEVGRFLNAIGVHDRKTKLSTEDLSDLKALVAVQKDRRGFGVEQLEAVTERLQAWVRAQGFPVAVAYIPSQTIEDGILHVEVSLGVVANVVIAGSSSGLNADQGDAVAGRLAKLIGNPVQRADVETRLNILNRNPAYSVQAGFQPGTEVGDTELKVHVRRQQDRRMTVQIDNFGVKDVGEERISLALGHSDLIRSGDRVDVSLSSSFESDGQQFGGVSYRTDALDRSVRTSLAYANVSTGGGRAADGLLFDTEVLDTRLFTRQKRSEVVYHAGWHDVEGPLDDAQTAWFLGAGWQGHRLWDEQKIALSGELGLRAGGVSQDARQADGNFWRLDGNARAWTPLSVPKLSEEVRLTVHSRWQWSTDRLSATQRFSATSARFNSGFPAGSLLTDSAIELGLGMRFLKNMGSISTHWSVAVDTMFGEDNALATWQHLTTLALGMEAELYRDHVGVLSSTLKLGYPISHKSNGVLNDDGTQLFWSLRYAR